MMPEKNIINNKIPKNIDNKNAAHQPSKKDLLSVVPKG